MKALRSLMRKVRKGEGGFTLIELLIVIIILGILAAVVAFNVGGFLGAGTCETAKTEMAAVQTAIIAGMANVSAGTITGGNIIAGETTKPVSYGSNQTFLLESFLKLPTHGNWTWDSSGVVTDGSYSGGGKTATYTNGNWSGSACPP